MNSKIVKTTAYILGPKTMHNEFLAYGITKEISVPSLIIKDFEEYFSSKSQTEPNSYRDSIYKLILIDCEQHSFEQILKILAMESDQKNRLHIALFNLLPITNIEKKAISKGIRGFFYKDDNMELFLKGVKAIIHGEIWISRKKLLTYLKESINFHRSIIRKDNSLTQREIEILSLISMGASNEEISKKMYISPHTVKTHLYNVYKKINVKNRYKAAIWAESNL